MTSTTSDRSQRAFFGVSALLFVASATATIIACRTMSMAWMRMPGQTWPGAAASFLGMWLVMMVAMMTPSLAPMLWRDRLGRFATLAGIGYFFVWTMIGAAVYPLGTTLAAIEMRRPMFARAAPIAIGVGIVVAAAFQFTVCRMPERGREPPLDAASAWNYGLRLGLDCAWCCAGYMTMLLVVGITDLRAMAVVTAAITVKRLKP
jgi:predicted metal-binding membrane protein